MASVLAVAISAGVTKGYGAWARTTQNSTNTASTIQLITPTTLASTHAGGTFAARGRSPSR